MGVLITLGQRVAAALIAVAIVRAVEHRRSIQDRIRGRIREG